MKIVTTHDVVSDWKKTFNFTDQEFTELKLGKIKLLVSQEKPECEASLQQYLFNGSFLADDDQTISSLITSSTQAVTLQYLLLNKDSGISFKVDPVSTVAAVEWSKQSSSAEHLSNYKVLDRVVQSFTVPVAVPPVDPADPPIKWFNLAVLIRTIVTCAVYLYTGRGEISFESKVRTAIGGVVLYLLHIGALKVLFKKMFHHVMERYFRLDRNNEYIDPNPRPAPNVAGVAVGAVPPRRLAPEDHISRRIQAVTDTVLKILKEGITIPKTPGVVYDVIAVLIGLVGSLFPRWTADGAALIEFN